MECTDLLGETSLCQANMVLLYATGFLCSPSMHVQFYKLWDLYNTHVCC